MCEDCIKKAKEYRDRINKVVHDMIGKVPLQNEKGVVGVIGHINFNVPCEHEDSKSHFQIKPINMNNYVVKPEDLTGDIKDFPIELVQWMVDQQVKQGNKADVEVFQVDRSNGKIDGGFDWGDTELGDNMCDEIITNENFDLFFKHFPKQEEKHFGLPELKTVEMEVSNDGVEWYKAFLVGVLNGKYIAVDGGIWHYCRPKQQFVKLTRAEIAEKFGVSKDFILED